MEAAPVLPGARFLDKLGRFSEDDFDNENRPRIAKKPSLKTCRLRAAVFKGGCHG